MKQSVAKSRNISFRRRGIIQKTAHNIPTKFCTHFSPISLLQHGPSISPALMSPSKQCFMTTANRQIPPCTSCSLFHYTLSSNMSLPLRILFRKTIYVLSWEGEPNFHTNTKEGVDFFFLIQVCDSYTQNGPPQSLESSDENKYCTLQGEPPSGALATT